MSGIFDGSRVEWPEGVSIPEGVSASPVPTAVPAREMVDHPAHYNADDSGVECIDIAERWGFNLGSALKYMWRAPYKGNRVEDLKKARWYLDREISRLERELK